MMTTAYSRQLAGLLFAGLLSTTAPAQTALIAHRSHGGAARTFRPGKASGDNFGIRPGQDRIITDKIVWLHGTRAVRYGHYVNYRGQPRPEIPARQDTVDLRSITGSQQVDQVLERLRQNFPQAELIGFDERLIRATWPAAE